MSTRVKFIVTLLESANRLENRLDRALSSIRGVSWSEYRLLSALSAFPEAKAMRVELAGAVGLTPSAITRALRPLEKIGFVQTLKSERDARRAIAQLTPAGEELLSDAQGVVKDVVASLRLGDIKGQEWIRVLDALAR